MMTIYIMSFRVPLEESQYLPNTWPNKLLLQFFPMYQNGTGELDPTYDGFLRGLQGTANYKSRLGRRALESLGAEREKRTRATTATELRLLREANIIPTNVSRETLKNAITKILKSKQ
jgi:hypothetical protein